MPLAIEGVLGTGSEGFKFGRRTRVSDLTAEDYVLVPRAHSFENASGEDGARRRDNKVTACSHQPNSERTHTHTHTVASSPNRPHN
jgi:hypothetical protein